MDRDPRGLGAGKSTACDSEGAATSGVSSILRIAGSPHTQRSDRVHAHARSRTSSGEQGRSAEGT